MINKPSILSNIFFSRVKKTVCGRVYVSFIRSEIKDLNQTRRYGLRLLSLHLSCSFLPAAYNYFCLYLEEALLELTYNYFCLYLEEQEFELIVQNFARENRSYSDYLFAGN